MTAPAPLEIWAGMECTVNRVGNHYFDQLTATGHDSRDDDLDRFADLGIRTLRYPLLWERVAPAPGPEASWSWCDRRMARLDTLGIRPVVGLLHHGSGPNGTSLVDPGFPSRFEEYAASVSRRYPSVTRWIPINEPLTTARFSCLYAHWHPHQRDDRQFARAIVGQCIATARAMAAIRAVNPVARLIQTEDLGRACSTPRLAYQAEMENERRWLTFDLLCGRVRRGHVMWEWLGRAGADLEALAWLEDHPSPPDVLGINHYLTSDRFLDERMDRYPSRCRGGNGRDRYADTEAVRVCAEGPAGLSVLLREAWDRYRIPIAITEAHLDCSRDEQLRWLIEARETCEDLAATGVSVLALTVWSLLGSFNWNALVTVPGDYYESGVFDVRGAAPRETRLASVIRAWTSGVTFDHPVLDGTGWWHRSVRLLYPPVPRVTGLPIWRPPLAPPLAPPRAPRRAPRRRFIVIAGATPAVRREFARASDLRDLPMQFVSHDDLAADVAGRGGLFAGDAWALVLAGSVRSLGDPDHGAHHIAAACVAALATAAQGAGCHVTLLSSHDVFGATRREAYRESDDSDPRTKAGQRSAAAERALLTAGLPALIVRAAACFADREVAPWLATDLRAVFPDGIGAGAACSLTYLPDFVRAVLDLAIDGERGLWHLANRGSIVFGEAIAMASASSPATHPLNGPNDGPDGGSDDGPDGGPNGGDVPYLLDSERAAILPRLDEALERAGYVSPVVGSSVAPSRRSASRSPWERPRAPAIRMPS